MAAVQNFFIR